MNLAMSPDGRNRLWKAEGLFYRVFCIRNDARGCVWRVFWRRRCPSNRFRQGDFLNKTRYLHNQPDFALPDLLLERFPFLPAQSAGVEAIRSRNVAPSYIGRMPGRKRGLGSLAQSWADKPSAEPDSPPRPSQPANDNDHLDDVLARIEEAMWEDSPWQG